MILPTAGIVEGDQTTDRSSRSERAKDAERAQQQQRDAAAARAAEERESVEIDPEAIAAAVESSQAAIFGPRSIEFSYDKDINRVIVRVKEADTDEIVRQIPPESFVTFQNRIRDAVGVLFNEIA